MFEVFFNLWIVVFPFLLCFHRKELNNSETLREKKEIHSVLRYGISIHANIRQGYGNIYIPLWKKNILLCQTFNRHNGSEVAVAEGGIRSDLHKRFVEIL